MAGKRGAAAPGKAPVTKKRGRQRNDKVEAEPQQEDPTIVPEEEAPLGQEDGNLEGVQVSETIDEDQKPTKRRKKEALGASLQPIPALFSQAGRVFVCGQGDSGQLGLGNQNEDDDMGEVARPSHSPLSAENPRVIHIVAGGMHSVAVTDEGQVFTTGVNDEAALGRKTDTDIYKNLAGKAGDAFKWGRVNVPQDFGKVVQVSAGDSHTAALTELGAVYSWGVFRGNSGPYAFQPNLPFALKPVLVYRPNSANSQIVQISSGADHVLALRRDGSVLSWGFGEQGQLGRLGIRMRNPEETQLQPRLVPLHNIKGLKGRAAKASSVAAGTFGSFVITTHGQVIAFGVNASGQLGFNTTSGKVEDNLFTRPTLVTTLPDAVTSIAAGKSHSLALTSKGEVLSFGLQTYGRLGREEADTSSDKPLAPGKVKLQQEDAVSFLAAGSDTSAVVTVKGEGYMFGLGTNRQLTRVNDDDAELPFKVKKEKFVTTEAVSKILQIAMGGQHTLLLVQ